MKKKGFFVTGAAVIAAAGILAGCGGSTGGAPATTAANNTLTDVTAQSVAQLASESVDDIKSYSFEATTKMKYSAASSGVNFDSDMSMKMDGEGIIDTHEVHMNADMDVNTMGQEMKQTNEQYAVMEDGKYMIYSKSEGEGYDGKWQKNESDTVVEFEKLNNVNVYKRIADGEIEAVLSEGEKVNGKDTYKLTAKIPGDIFGEVYSAMGQDASAMSGVDFTKATADCELYIYKDSGYPARTYMDAREYGENLFKQSMSQSGADMSNISFTIDLFEVDMIMDNYNQYDKIEVPADVLSEV